MCPWNIPSNIKNKIKITTSTWHRELSHLLLELNPLPLKNTKEQICLPSLLSSVHSPSLFTHLHFKNVQIIFSVLTWRTIPTPMHYQYTSISNFASQIKYPLSPSLGALQSNRNWWSIKRKHNLMLMLPRNLICTIKEA